MHTNFAHAPTSGASTALLNRKYSSHTDSAASSSPRAKTRKRSSGGRSHGKPERITVSDKQFVTHSLDPDAGVWFLQVNHRGDAVLKLNNFTVSTLSCRVGSAVLNTEACPFERAADVVAAISLNLALEMSDKARTDFEFDLARWIPLYFDL